MTYFILANVSFTRFQMTSNDKDFRFMATNDLLAELQKDSIKLDDEAEKKIVKTLLHLLKDSNAEVQNLAVKWYSFTVDLSSLFNFLLFTVLVLLSQKLKKLKWILLLTPFAPICWGMKRFLRKLQASV